MGIFAFGKKRFCDRLAAVGEEVDEDFNRRVYASHM